MQYETQTAVERVFLILELRRLVDFLNSFFGSDSIRAELYFSHMPDGEPIRAIMIRANGEITGGFEGDFSFVFRAARAQMKRDSKGAK